MGAAGEGRQRVDLHRGVERMILLAGILPGELFETDLHVSATHAIVAVLEFNVGCSDFHLLGREIETLPDDFARADGQGSAMTDQRTRPEAAGADELRTVGI